MSPRGHLEVSSLADFHGWVRDFNSGLRGDEIILLFGEMGTGKTEFAKTLARERGLPATVSPTFALHQIIGTGARAMDHLDLYRLESLDDLETVGLWEILQSNSLVVIEWAERVPRADWPRDRVRWEIHLEKQGEGRRISWSREGAGA